MSLSIRDRLDVLGPGGLAERFFLVARDSSGVTKTEIEVPRPRPKRRSRAPKKER